MFLRVIWYWDFSLGNLYYAKKSHKSQPCYNMENNKEKCAQNNKFCNILLIFLGLVTIDQSPAFMIESKAFRSLCFPGCVRLACRSCPQYSVTDSLEVRSFANPYRDLGITSPHPSPPTRVLFQTNHKSTMHVLDGF